MKNSLFFLIFFGCSLLLSAQNSSDTLNQFDNGGNKHGYWKKYDADTLKYEGRFEHGIPVGEFKYYYFDGKLKTTMVYTNSGKESDAILFFNNGNKMAEGKFINKLRHGLWITYDGNDHIISKVNYVNGKKSGSSIYFYPEGGKLEEVNFVNGIEHGLFVQYFPDQVVKTKGTYENGKFHGIFAYYYPNSQVFNTGKYDKNLKEGVWNMFDEDGKIIVKVTYSKGNVINREVFQKDKDPETINQKISDEELKKRGSGIYENGINDSRYDGY